MAATVVVNNNPDLGSLLAEMKLDENNIVTIEETENDPEASSSRGSQVSQGREVRDRRGRSGRRVRVRPRRCRHEESEEPVSPKQVPMKNAVMMLNEMFPPPGSLVFSVRSRMSHCNCNCPRSSSVQSDLYDGDSQQPHLHHDLHHR